MLTPICSASFPQTYLTRTSKDSQKEFHREGAALLHSDALCKVSWLVYVAASAYCYVVGEELQGDYFEDGQE